MNILDVGPIYIRDLNMYVYTTTHITTFIFVYDTMTVHHHHISIKFSLEGTSCTNRTNNSSCVRFSYLFTQQLADGVGKKVNSQAE